MDNEEPNQIVAYMHCAQCLGELPDGVSPAEYARTQTGLTADGNLQIWCNRHDVNVAIISDIDELAAGISGHSCPECSSELTMPTKSYGKEVH